MQLCDNEISQLVRAVAIRCLEIGCKGILLERLVRSFPSLKGVIAEEILNSLRIDEEHLFDSDHRDDCSGDYSVLCGSHRLADSIYYGQSGFFGRCPHRRACSYCKRMKNLFHITQCPGGNHCVTVDAWVQQTYGFESEVTQIYGSQALMSGSAEVRLTFHPLFNSFRERADQNDVELFRYIRRRVRQQRRPHQA